MVVLERSEDALREAFNESVDRPRLLMLVSPTCVACRKGASIMQDEVLERIDAPSLRAFVGWVPILPEDNGDEASKSASLVADARAAHFWDAGKSLPGPFAATLGLPEGWPAWDVYLIYPPGATWQDAPPAPSYWEHQLGERPGAPLLDGAVFRERLWSAIEAAG
jgi:hypothetical protein